MAHVSGKLIGNFTHAGPGLASLAPSRALSLLSLLSLKRFGIR